MSYEKPISGLKRNHHIRFCGGGENLHARRCPHRPSSFTQAPISHEDNMLSAHIVETAGSSTGRAASCQTPIRASGQGPGSRAGHRVGGSCLRDSVTLWSRPVSGCPDIGASPGDLRAYGQSIEHAHMWPRGHPSDNCRDVACNRSCRPQGSDIQRFRHAPWHASPQVPGRQYAQP